MNQCYDYEEYNFNNPLIDVDATYIIHLKDNGRYDSIIDQLSKFPISKKVFIVVNKGYKKCKKHPSITKPPLDLVDAYLEIFQHAKEKNNILILEDDFIFDDKILEPFHRNNINKFIKNHSNFDFIYYLGALPGLLLPYDYYNYRNIFSIGTHSVIYSKKSRVNIRDNKINDWDLFLNSKSRYIYYTPLCYQLFTETENTKHWGDHHYILFLGGIIAKIFIKLFNLNHSIEAYSYFYFVSKIFIFVLLILILFSKYLIYK